MQDRPLALYEEAIVTSAQTVEHIPRLTVGWRMKMALADAGVSVAEIAEYLGVDRATVTRWTSDQIPPKRVVLVAWAMRTGVPLAWLEQGRHSAY